MFTQRFEELLTEILHTKTGEFAAIVRYDRSYISHLRNGDRVPKPGHRAAARLARAVCLCAAEKRATEALCRRVGVPPEAGEEALCAAVEVWLFGSRAAAESTRRGRESAPRRALRSSFGTRLGLAMELAGISAMRLARTLNVDASLISKYRGGLRVPRMNHPIIHALAETLSARIYTLERAEGLAQLLGEPRDALLSEVDGARLLEAWLRDYTVVDTSLIEGLLEGMDAFPAEPNLPLLPPEEAAGDAAPEEGEACYDGIQGLRRAVLRFLAAAVSRGQEELWLYSDQSMEWMVEDPDFILRWRSLMGAYVGGGGGIRIIHNVDRGLGEMVDSIRSWLPLYLSGGIEGWYSLRPVGERFAHTLFLAPGMACVSGTCVAGRERHARYRYALDGAELARCRGVFEDLLAECRPLLTMSGDVGAGTLDAVTKGRATHTVVRTLPLWTMPEPLLRSMLDRAALPEETARRILSDRARQRELAMGKLAQGVLHECAVLPGEEALFEGRAAADTARASLFYTPEEFGEHLRAAIELSESEPGYRIFLLDEPPFEHIRLVLSDHAAEISHLSAHPVRFTVTHPLMCRAFVDFAVRLEEQYDVDRAALRDRLRQYQ